MMLKLMKNLLIIQVQKVIFILELKLRNIERNKYTSQNAFEIVYRVMNLLNKSNKKRFSITPN